MLSEHQNKNANFLRILMTLRALRQRGDITEKEYRRAKKYYQALTGADIVVAARARWQTARVPCQI